MPKFKSQMQQIKSQPFLAGKCPATPPCRRVKRHNQNEISFAGSPALWAGSFKFDIHLTFACLPFGRDFEIWISEFL
jgi:hypothetical protein